MAACFIAVQANGSEGQPGNPPAAFDLVIAIMVAAVAMVLVMLIRSSGRRAPRP